MSETNLAPTAVVASFLFLGVHILFPLLQKHSLDVFAVAESHRKRKEKEWVQRKANIYKYL